MLQSYRSSRRSLLLLCATVIAVGLSACSRDAPAPLTVAPAATFAQAPAPVVVQQAAASSHGLGDMVVGAAIGSLATHALTSNRQVAAAPQPSTPAVTPIVFNKTVIHKTIVQAPPSPAPALPARTTVSLDKANGIAPAPRISAASYRPAMSYRTTTATVRYKPSASANAHK